MEFAIFPTRKAESLSTEVAKVVAFIKSTGYSYTLGAMGTTIETPGMEEATEILLKSQQILAASADRVYCTAKFDIVNKPGMRMHEKIASVQKKIGEVQK
jgi:uncharacterized protein YqgV (UPF0045/DUF77 family)